MEEEPVIKKVKLDNEVSESVTPDNDSKDAVKVKDEEIEVKVSDSTESTENRMFKETDVGIEEYINNIPGFHAIIKQRYSDFLVNEVDENGKVIELTKEEPPPATEDSASTTAMEATDKLPTDKSADTPTDKPEDTPADSSADTSTDTIEVTEMCQKLLSADEIEKLKQMKLSSDKKAYVLLEAGNDKDRRCLIHQAIRKSFPGFESNTTDIGDQKYIKVHKSKNYRDRNQGKKRGFRQWLIEDGDYCRFVLYKENKDTMDAVWLLSKILKVNRGLFQYAGTKDRRAKTTQEMTAYRIEAQRILKLNSTLRNMEIGGIRYVKSPLRLGQLSGNRFTIVLRDVRAEDTLINQAMTSLKDIGFINYYGMQRFGTTVVPTYMIGLAVIKSKWQEAVELILKPRPGEDEFTTKWRNIWWKTRNAKVALEKTPARHGIEKQVLTGLKKYGDRNFSNAFCMIPRNTRTMYLHSYQSFVWNQAVSRRIRHHGLKPIIGDLVLPKDTHVKLETEIGEEDEEDVVDDKPADRPKPVVLDQSNLSNFTIQDVVLPLPGYDVMYPNNEGAASLEHYAIDTEHSIPLSHIILTLSTPVLPLSIIAERQTGGEKSTNFSVLVKDWMDEILAKDGISLEILKSKDKAPYKMPGTYRRIVSQPKNVEWQTYRYNDYTIPLALSDQDRLKGLPEPLSVEDGKLKALKVVMTLSQSCYATMAIREVVKTDTSSAHQTTLNPSGDKAEGVTS